MKKLCFLTGMVLLGAFRPCLAATNDSTEQNVNRRILGEIQDDLSQKNRSVDSTIQNLDLRVGRLDSLLKLNNNPKERLDKLVERVQLLEQKQQAVEANEQAVYEANYQSAFINLAVMDREIKPLLLFHTTRDFFNQLTETGNPTSYEAFNSGFSKFRAFAEKWKNRDATMRTVSDMITTSGSLTYGLPLVGAYSQLLFAGMARYVNSIGHKRRELKREAEAMFSITTTLSQFNTDEHVTEQEWEGITGALQQMQVNYDTTLNRNLRLTGLSRQEFEQQFVRQSDANMRYDYLTMMRNKATAYVDGIKRDYPKDWKEMVYYQLMDVQTLKIKYGDLTLRIREHMNKYDDLIKHYKSNKDIGTHVARLDEKLNELKATFDATFEPSEYIHSATQMYKVM